MSNIAKLSPREQEVLEVIKMVPDPEVGINIVDLGLIYEVEISDIQKTIDVDMTLSARGCPVGDTIILHVKTVLENMFPGYQAKVNLVWEPRWTPDMITPEGREQINY